MAYIVTELCGYICKLKNRKAGGEIQSETRGIHVCRREKMGVPAQAEIENLPSCVWFSSGLFRIGWYPLVLGRGLLYSFHDSNAHLFQRHPHHTQEKCFTSSLGISPIKWTHKISHYNLDSCLRHWHQETMLGGGSNNWKGDTWNLQPL